MTGKNQHVVPREEGWAVRGEGNTRDTSLHRTQAEAERAAKKLRGQVDAEVARTYAQTTTSGPGLSSSQRNLEDSRYGQAGNPCVTGVAG